MAVIDQKSIQRTLEKVKKRKADFAKKQAEKEIQNISPEVFEAVRKMGAAKSTFKDKDDSGSVLFPPNRDFIAMMREYRKKHGCSGFEAHRAISKDFPDALERCIREANN
jgi:hypothetical protein